MFDVDRDGLAAILERRGRSFALAELVANAWDSGTDRVDVTIEPLANVPCCRVVVEDWGDGFSDLSDAYTMFARSRRAGDPEKRGRFCLGEKLVLAVCREATITTTCGSVSFDASTNKRTRGRGRRDAGTEFVGVMRMTRSEHEDAVAFLRRMIPPVPTTINGVAIDRPPLVTSFTARLPTEVADADGNLRRSMRSCVVEVYANDDAPGIGGEVYEMGVPVVECDIPYRVNVLQKVPLNMDRDNVTPAFMRALRAEVLNHTADRLDAEAAAEPWVSEAVADPRADATAVRAVVTARFGENAVIATPGAPLSNAAANAAGYTVVPGGALPSGAWANVRKAEALLPSSAVFRTASPASMAEKNAGECPMCGRPRT